MYRVDILRIYFIYYIILGRNHDTRYASATFITNLAVA